MKIAVLLVPLALAGCHTAAPQPLPLPKPVAAPPAPVITPPAAPSSGSSIAYEQKLRQQRQIIEALMSQNDALTAKLDTVTSAPAPDPVPVLPVPSELRMEAPVPAAPIPVPSQPAPSAPSQEKPEVVLTPNAEGVIDLAALAAPAAEPVNPFAVRATGVDPARDLVLAVTGIVGGANPAALVNGRAIQVGETIESLTLERCEPDAAIFRRGEYRLRLTVDPKPVRVRGAL